MQRKTKILVGIVIALIVGWLIYSSMSSPSNPDTPQNKQVKESPHQQKQPARQNASGPRTGMYEKVDLGVVQNNHYTKYLVFFYADFCGGCKQMKPIWYQVKENYDGVNDIKMVEVDSQTNNALCDKHNIRTIPTIKLCYGDVENPSKVVEYNGKRNFDDLVVFMQNH